MRITQNQHSKVLPLDTKKSQLVQEVNWDQIDRSNDILSIDYYIQNGRLSEQILSMDQTIGGIYVIPLLPLEHKLLKKKLDALVLSYFADLQRRGKQYSEKNILAFTVGRFNGGDYKDDNGLAYSKQSLALEIKGIDQYFLLAFEQYLKEQLNLDQVLFKSYCNESISIG